MNVNSHLSDDHSMLSLKDLLEARDAYHVHLANKQNVVGTAVGRYRIRKSDPDVHGPDKVHIHQERNKLKTQPPRTLANSVVKWWSWPCVLVFVETWEQKESFKARPDQMVPYYLYMPDGRIIPTCVVAVERQEGPGEPIQNLTFPTQMIGGGYPIFTENQGTQHIGSLGCLVTDGDQVYALTNHHVCGEAGREIMSMMGDKKVVLGKSAPGQLGKMAFSKVYPGWPGTRAYANLDAGLIRVEDVECWTAQVYGIGEIDLPVDLNTQSIKMDLIGQPVVAYGGASGKLQGKIEALFYRYKTVGGNDYIADLLIGPRDENTPLATRPGDSGTLWFMEPDSAKPAEAIRQTPRLRPVALQWGGHAFLNPEGKQHFQFALASCLSTICRELDVEIIRDWNIGHSEYWGKLGHYKIAAKACELLPDKDLRAFFMANVDRIAYDDQAIVDGALQQIDSHDFVPLADVADLVWRLTRKADEANHFADMDQKGQGRFEGKTLLDLCADPDNINVDVWNKFYQSMGEDDKRGALPFRIWQCWTQMVEYVRQGNVTGYLCTAGVMAHYAGDACQPLHISYLHHGDPQKPEEKPVHSTYETQMLDRNAAEVVAGVNKLIKHPVAKADIRDGHGAAQFIIELMRETINKLPPETIVEAFNNKSGGGSRAERMWETLGDATCDRLAAGCQYLAQLWQSAWDVGGGNQIPKSELIPIDKDELYKLYMDKSFVESKTLQEMAPLLEAGAATRGNGLAAGGTSRRSRHGV